MQILVRTSTRTFKKPGLLIWKALDICRVEKQKIRYAHIVLNNTRINTNSHAVLLAVLVGTNTSTSTI